MRPKDQAPMGEADMMRIMSLHGAGMKRTCYMYLRDTQLAEDAVQEAFIKIYKSGAAFRGECSEKTWVMRITMNVCRDMLRTGWFRMIDRRTPAEEIVRGADDPQADSAVLDAVMNLPPRLREVVLLRYYQEMSAQEIAASLGVNVNTVWRRLKSARRILHDRLEGWYFDEP